jgi:3-oxoadipate enol-lactonase
MPFIQVRDIEMYYERKGNGEKVLFISGTGGDLRRKPSTMDRPISQWFDLLAYDQRGYGQTDKPDIAYSMRDYAEDAAALLDVLEWEKCHVIGVSFGGMVAQEFAIRYPERINRLVLAVTSSGAEGEASLALHELLKLSPEEATREFVDRIDSRWNEAWKEKNSTMYHAIFEHMLHSVFREGNIGSKRALEARAGHNTSEGLPSLEMPVYVIGGKYDLVAPPATIEALAVRIPHSHVELFDHGHTSWLEDSRVWERIRSFLEEQ